MITFFRVYIKQFKKKKKKNKKKKLKETTCIVKICYPNYEPTKA